ncbi:hypothetical protein [Intrasporangium calvum]|nr:hypothetical protein [Intrasporangium calvum]
MPSVRALAVRCVDQQVDVNTEEMKSESNVPTTGWNPYSIRINQQWRICFTWTPAEDVEIGDHH